MAVVQVFEKKKYELRLVVETFFIIEKILEAKGAVGLTQICHSTQIPKNKAFRMLATLVQCGILEKDERSNYKLGVTSIENAHKILARESLSERPRLIMESLSRVINEAVYFAKYDGFEAVLVDFVDCCQPIKATSFIGVAIPLPLESRSTTVTKIGDINVETNGLFAEITTVSVPFVNGKGVEIGALVIVAPTYRMTQYRIKTEIVPALRDALPHHNSQTYHSLQEILLPMVKPARREYSSFNHLVPERSTFKVKERQLTA